MKKQFLVIIFALFLLVGVTSVNAQCSICTKTAQQLGEKPARSLNSGIIYLMMTPFAIAGYIGYKWWQGEKAVNSDVD